MKKISLITALLVLAGVLALSCKGNVPRTLVIPQKPTRTPVRTPSMTPSPTITLSPTWSVTSTQTSTYTHTATTSPTATLSPTATSSPTSTATATATPTITDTPTQTSTPTSTSTPTPTYTLPPFSGNEFDTTTGWSVASPNGVIASATAETLGGCPATTPTSGSYMGRWTCPSCSTGLEAVTLMYTAAPSIRPNVVAIDVMSCGTSREVNIQVEDSLGTKSALSLTTSCATPGACDLNVWDTLYIDISATSLVDIEHVYIIGLGIMDNTSTIYLDRLRGLSSAPSGCP